MQLVKHVLEDLARFNPEARMEPEIEMGSLSPVTECNVTIPEDEVEEEKMGKEYADLEEENSDLKGELESHKRLWGEVNKLATNAPESSQTLTDILEMVLKAQAL